MRISDWSSDVCSSDLLARKPSRAGWDAARQIAVAALSGRVEPSVGMATHYHADYVVPYWAASLAKIAQVDRHIFYRWTAAGRSEERRVGEEWVRTCRSGWSP